VLCLPVTTSRSDRHRDRRYQREGLDAKIIYIDARIAIAALVAGEVDTVVISAPSVIPPVLSGANIAFIAGLHNKMIFSFHAQPDIQSPAQLRGKIVGTNRPGTPADYGNRVALAKMGLKPTDVQLMPLGSSGVMWQALQTRQIAGVTLAPPYSFRADAEKFSRLVDTYDKPYQNTGVVVRRDRIHPMADIWLRLLRALRQAILRFYEDRSSPCSAEEVHAAIRSDVLRNLRMRPTCRLYQGSQGLRHRLCRHPRFSGNAPSAPRRPLRQKTRYESGGGK
jgi:ABC-type nitrate/sulfonate/bicarbonate transport system substrate-binding protein